MGQGLWDKLKGILEIEITGTAVERFLNLTLQEGIVLKDIRWLSPTKVCAYVLLKDIWYLRPIARAGRCQFHIRRRLGLPFYLARAGKRKILLFGSVFFIITFYILCNFAYYVCVDSPYEISPKDIAQVLEIAEEQGVKEGRLIWMMDFRRTEKEVMKQKTDLVFCGIERNGTKITINIVKRTLPAEDDRKLPYGHIFAKEDGVIEEILIIKGTAKVKRGDPVAAGQLLIAGFDQSGPVTASGVIRASVWYQGYGECPLSETLRKDTGRKAIGITLAWDGKEQVVIWGKAYSPYALFSEAKQRERLVVWRNIKLPVEVIKTKYIEEEETIKTRSADAAWQKAVQQAVAAAKKDLPPYARIKQTIIRPLGDSDQGQLKRAQVTLWITKDIGYFVEMNQEQADEIRDMISQEKEKTANN